MTMWKENDGEKPKKKKYLYLDKFDAYRAEKDTEHKSVLKSIRLIRASGVMLYIIQLVMCISVLGLYYLILR